MPRLKPGDIVEIGTARGLAYAQYTHRHAMYGALLRVFGTFYSERPSSFADVTAQEPAFHCFFPLGAAVHREIVTIVGCEPLPMGAQALPLFRSGVVDPATGRVAMWWLWDGQKEWRVGDLSSEHRALPVRGVWNDTLLVERIEQGWTDASQPD